MSLKTLNVDRVLIRENERILLECFFITLCEVVFPNGFEVSVPPSLGVGIIDGTPSVIFVPGVWFVV